MAAVLRFMWDASGGGWTASSMLLWLQLAHACTHAPVYTCTLAHMHTCTHAMHTCTLAHWHMRRAAWCTMDHGVSLCMVTVCIVSMPRRVK